MLSHSFQQSFPQKSSKLRTGAPQVQHSFSGVEPCQQGSQTGTMPESCWFGTNHGRAEPSVPLWPHSAQVPQKWVGLRLVMVTEDCTTPRLAPLMVSSVTSSSTTSTLIHLLLARNSMHEVHTAYSWL